MQYIECPNLEAPKHPSVFLAGGITDCPDWQSDIVKLIKDIDDNDLISLDKREKRLQHSITIFNPRRKQFPIDDPKSASEQIYWEYLMLIDADFISFWFPRETLCPIVLFELGNWLSSRKPIVIGIDPDYKRKLDVEIQTKLARTNIKICYSIVELAKQIWQMGDDMIDDMKFGKRYH